MLAQKHSSKSYVVARNTLCAILPCGRHRVMDRASRQYRSG